MQPFGHPALVIGFNRPRHLHQVLSATIAARPSVVYVSVDGPRPGNPADAEANRVIRTFLNGLSTDVPIRIRTLNHNEGSGPHVAGAISWMFETEEFGAILEDDCLPSPSFFDFVRLGYDVADPLVYSIAGFTPAPAAADGEGSYYRSLFPITWGWATWKQHWQRHRMALGDWRGELGTGELRDLGGSLPWFTSFWSRRFDELQLGSRRVWDYQWIYCVWAGGGRSLSPVVNLVQNIGFGKHSTHTFFARRAYARPSIVVPNGLWGAGEAWESTARAADIYVHSRFYKVGRAWPATASARALVRPLVNGLLR